MPIPDVIEEEFIEETIPKPRPIFQLVETIEITEAQNIIPMSNTSITANQLKV